MFTRHQNRVYAEKRPWQSREHSFLFQQTRIILPVGFFAAVLMAGIAVFGLGCQQEPPRQILKYWIVEKEDQTKALTSKMEYRVMISTDTVIPSEAALRDTALAIWRENNDHQDRFTIFMYLPDMDPHRLAYGVAEFDRKGLQHFMLNDYALRGTRWEHPQTPDTGQPKTQDGKIPVRYERK